MHLDLPHLADFTAPLDDEKILAQVPAPLAEALRHRNGCVAYQGGLHVRGACQAPAWHSLRAAWEGPDSLHALYEEVLAEDVPFAEDALGDQFLVRDGAVLRLRAETGDVEPVAASLEDFFAAVLAAPQQALELGPLLDFLEAGQRLAPGQLLSAYPPFCAKEAEQGVDLRSIDALERRRFLADLARQLREVPDGGRVEIKAHAPG